jgi:type II protein arginine methyltransferase
MTMTQDPLSQAFEHFQAGRLDQAAQFCRAILQHHPDNAATNHLLGVIYFQQGKMSAAREFLSRAAAAAGATAEIHNNYGAVLNALGENEAAIAAFERALNVNPDYAEALNNLGVIYREAQRTDEAIGVFRRALALNPALAQAKANLRSTYRDVVPVWHFAMMDDQRRNTIYEAAIARAVRGKRVLDIGTGAGLLAMMAARAGAKHVTSCEIVGLIAERARDIVAENGFADRIDVVAKRSTELVVGTDLAEQAQVLITETFSSELIDEDVLPAVEHAHAQLLVPGATVIPAAASAMGYLAGGELLRGMLFVERVAGFNLAKFNDFAPPSLAASLDGLPHEVLSDDAELLRFELQKQAIFPMGGRPMTIRATKRGVCVGLVQWIKLELDAETRYENRPSHEAYFNRHWTHVVYRFPKLIPVEAGDQVRIMVRHDRSRIKVNLVE